MEIITKYFLDKDGAITKRLSSPAGMGHFEIAKEIVGDLKPGTTYYDSMYKWGYIRCVETPDEILVDAPKKVNNKQMRALKDMAITPPGQKDKSIVINDIRVRESRDPRGMTPAPSLGDQIIGESGGPGRI